MLVKTVPMCPVCEHKNCSFIYENKDEAGGKFYLYMCKSPGCETKRRIRDVNDYLNELTGQSEPKEKEEDLSKEETGLIPPGEFVALDNPDHPWGKRAISVETCKLFGVTVNPDAPLTESPNKIDRWTRMGLKATGVSCIFPNYDENGRLIAQKSRCVNPETKERSFIWFKKGTGDVNARKTFFGQKLWNPQQHSKLVIVFGEFDAMATHQMIGGMPVVSAPDGDDSAKKMVERYYNWLRKFKEIIFIPDNDGKCIKVVEALAAKFPRQAKIVMLTKHKDPSDYLVHGDTNLFRQEFFSAQPFTPQKIVGLSSFKKELFSDPPVPIAQYPWDGLNQMTGGIWAGELITIKAPPKVGKSTIMNEIAYNLYLNNPNERIGMIYLEETKRDLVFRLVGMKLNKNLQRPEIREQASKEEIAEAFADLTDPERFFIVEHWGACSSDFLEEKITELVLATGCQYIFFDHISMAITDESNKDERLALDRLVTAIKSLTVGIPDVDETGNDIVRQPTVFMVTHVNDNGQPRGSRVAIQVSNLVLGLHRDKMSDSQEERNTLTILVEENRRYGDTGLACRLRYDWVSGRLSEIMSEETETKKKYVYDTLKRS